MKIDNEQSIVDRMQVFPFHLGDDSHVTGLYMYLYMTARHLIVRIGGRI